MSRIPARPAPTPGTPAAPSAVVLLGPQRFEPTLGEAARALGITGYIATITAGWQEREGDDTEFDQHLGGLTVNLRLYERGRAVFSRDPDLATAHRSRQDRLRALQALYAARLAHLKDAVIDLLGRNEEACLLDPEVEDAFAAIRALDRHHLERVRAIHAEFDAATRPGSRSVLGAERKAIAERLDNAEAVAIAGGHIAVLLNRLRLFDVASLVGRRPVLAWSAGAMAVSERVVLFHDHPPQGAGAAAVFEAGLGLARGLILLPHAHRRLALGDRRRVELLARRFAPDVCLVLDDGAWVRAGDRGLAGIAGLRQAHDVARLLADGTLEPIGDAA